MSDPLVQPGEQPTETSKPKRKVPRWLWITVAVLAVLWIIGTLTSNASSKKPTASAPRSAHAVASTTPAATSTPDQNLAGPQTAFDDGTYLVGTDIQPGTYKSDGDGPCYWARLSSTDGTVGSIIANFIGSGPQVVTIAPSDDAFTSQGCGTWVQTVP